MPVVRSFWFTACLLCLALLGTACVADTATPSGSTDVRVSGKVVDANGAPQSKVSVTIAVFEWLKPGASVATVKTDANGAFTVDVSSPVPSQRRTVTLYAGSPDGAAVGQVSPASQASVQGLTLTLQPTANLRIHVVGDGGKPLPNATFQPLYFRTNKMFIGWTPELNPAWSQKTDDTGNATFSGLPRGFALEVQTDDPWYSTDSKDVQSSVDASTGGPSFPDQTIYVEPAASISGTVVDSTTHKPAAYASLDDSSCGECNSTDANGHFEYDHMKPGPYTINVDDSDGQADLTASAQSVDLAPGQSYNMAFSLVRGATITGKVVDDKLGQPISGTEVSVHGLSNSNPQMTIKTDPDGTYRVRVAPGAQTLSASNGPANSEQVTIQVADSDTKTIDLKLPDDAFPRPVHGRVLGPDGKPVAGATVIGRKLWQHDIDVTSGADGSFSFGPPGIVSGTELYARAGDLASPNKTLPDFVHGVTLTLKKGVLCSIGGRVVDQDGKPLPGAKVSLTSYIGMNPTGDAQTAMTDAHGNYAFAPNLPNAPYSVSVDHDGYSAEGTSRVYADPGSRVVFPAVKLYANNSFVGGIILNPNGNPVDGAKVSYNGQSVTTGRDGRFELAHVSCGRVGLQVESQQIFYRVMGDAMSGRNNNFLRVYTDSEFDAWTNAMVQMDLFKWPIDPEFHGDGQDANVLLSRSESQAASEHKKVLLVFYGHYCHPCYRLHCYLEDRRVKPIMDAHFVVLDLDLGDKEGWANPGAGALYDKYTGQVVEGVPFFTLLDPAGKEVGVSLLNHQNMGMPEAPAEVGYFLATLKKADPRMTPSEIRTLGVVIKSYAEKAFWKKYARS